MLVVHAGTIDYDRTSVPVAMEYGEYRGFSLEGQIVSFRSHSSSAETHVTWDPLEGEPECPDEGNARYYGWVVPMSRVTPGEGMVLGRFRQPPRNPPEQFEAVLQVESGHLSALGFARDSDGVILWEFDRGLWRLAIRAALGDPVQLRQEDWDKPVELEFLNVLTRKSETLVLEPKDGSDRLLVEVFNVPEKEICCWPKPGDIEENDHFPHLYGLLPSDAVRSTPRLVGHCPDPGDDEKVPGSCLRDCPDLYSNPQCPGADMSRP